MRAAHNDEKQPYGVSPASEFLFKIDFGEDWGGYTYMKREKRWWSFVKVQGWLKNLLKYSVRHNDGIGNVTYSLAYTISSIIINQQEIR